MLSSSLSIFKVFASNSNVCISCGIVLFLSSFLWMGHSFLFLHMLCNFLFKITFWISLWTKRKQKKKRLSESLQIGFVLGPFVNTSLPASTELRLFIGWASPKWCLSYSDWKLPASSQCRGASHEGFQFSKTGGCTLQGKKKKKDWSEPVRKITSVSSTLEILLLEHFALIILALCLGPCLYFQMISMIQIMSARFEWGMFILLILFSPSSYSSCVIKHKLFPYVVMSANLSINYDCTGGALSPWSPTEVS